MIKQMMLVGGLLLLGSSVMAADPCCNTGTLSNSAFGLVGTGSIGGTETMCINGQGGPLWCQDKGNTPKELLKIKYDRIKASVKSYEDRICEEQKELDKLKQQLKEFDAAIDKVR